MSVLMLCQCVLLSAGLVSVIIFINQVTTTLSRLTETVPLVAFNATIFSLSS